jgi:hypothetical protein
VTTQASFGQRKRGTTAANEAALSPLSALPASDAVMLIDLKRLLNEAVPRVLDPVQLAKLNAHVEQFKKQFGLDLRSFERLALGFRFHSPRAGVTTTDIVAVVSGTFNSGAMLGVGRLAAPGKYQEQKYKNSTIYVFDVTQQGKNPLPLGLKVTQLAVAALDANSLVFGELSGVQATLDSQRARGRANAELIQLARRNPNSFLSFGANVPQSVTQGKDFGNDTINKDLASIRQAYGGLGVTNNGFDLTAIARTALPGQAKSLGDTLSALKLVGGVAVSQMPAEQGKLAQSALDSLTITTEGNETQIKLELAQAVVNELVRALNKGE